MIALDAHIDAHRRADATAVHHFTASPGPARHAAHVQGIIEYSVAGVGDHRVVGAIAILALKLSEVGDILQFTSPVRRLQRKRDRKSTRLNSSHSQISYAVFCLKKKKKKKR